MKSLPLAVFGVVALLYMISSAAALCPHPKFTIVSGHSACLNASSLATGASGVSVDDQQNIVVYHNNIRRVPFAANMQAMVWDEEIAMIAQKWASNCQYAHDGNAQRGVPGKYSVGQNIAYGYSNWNATMKAWADEVTQFIYGGTPTGVVGHYTQMVWASSTRVGCGAAYCGTTLRTFYVCNYAPAGNISPNKNKPYALAASSKGEKCPAKFVKGLCDCQGKTCYNDGTLNLNTCSCTCSSSYFIQPSCDLSCTRAIDASYCATWPASHCTTYYNVPYQCPNKCRWCPKAGI